MQSWVASKEVLGKQVVGWDEGSVRKQGPHQSVCEHRHVGGLQQCKPPFFCSFYPTSLGNDFIDTYRVPNDCVSATGP